MKNRSKKIPIAAHRKPSPNPLRIDPTRTITLRRNFNAQFRNRFNKLKLKITKLIIEEDALGLVPSNNSISTLNVVNAGDNCGVGQGGFQPGNTCAKEGSGEHSTEDKTTESKGIIGHLKAFGAKIGHLEHVAKVYVTDKIEASVLKLPPRAQKVVRAAFHVGKVGTAAAFATWTVGQALAEKVSVERGSTPEQARRLRGVLSSLDLAATKPTLIGAEVLHAAAPILFAASMVPPATAGYLAYSTARNPLATARAAKGLVRDAVVRAREKIRTRLDKYLTKNSEYDVANTVAQALEEHGYDDWYIAILSQALDELKDIHDAINLANSIYEENPEDTSVEQDDDSEQVLGDITENTRWKFNSDPEKLKAFQGWLKEQFQSELIGHTEEQLWTRYIEAGFKKGAGRAYDDTKGIAQDAEKLDFYRSTREEFLRSSFANPVAQEKVELLASRAFDEMEGITDDMSLKMSRVLADGMVQGKSPRDIARDLNDEVDIGKARSLNTAKTELSRAHAEGQLTALEDLGVEEVGVAVEWSTSGLGVTAKGYDSPCPECAEMQGVVLTIEEARGLIPLHPGCLCSWIPANVGEDSKDQKRSKKEIDKSLKESGASDESEEGGLDTDISTDRPQSILNFSLGDYSSDLLSFSEFIANAGDNCGVGSGGFQPGNTCAAKLSSKGEGSGELEKRVKDSYEKLYGGKVKLKASERKVVEAQYKKDRSILDLAEARKGSGDKVETKSVPISDKSFSVKDHVSKLVDVVKAHGGENNLADILDVRKSMAHLNREQQDKVIHEARIQGKISGATYEGRHGVTEEQNQARYTGHKGDERIGLLIVRNSEGDNCGVGVGGFQPGNTCAKGGSSEDISDSQHISNRIADYSEGHDIRRWIEQEGDQYLAIKQSLDAVRNEMVKGSTRPYKEVKADLERLYTAHDEAKARTVEKLREKLQSDNPVEMSIKFTKNMGKDVTEAANEGTNWVNGVVSNREGESVKVDMTVKRLAGAHQEIVGRSCYVGGNAKWAMLDPISGLDPKTTVHEMGHMLEEQVPGVKSAVQEFLKHRVGDEKPVSMNEIMSTDAYNQSEMGRKDNFDKYFDKASAYYVGKKYHYGESEILSMGLQSLYHDPAGFARHDPEYCVFVLGILKGHLRHAR